MAQQLQQSILADEYAVEFHNHRDLISEEVWCSLISRVLLSIRSSAIVLADLGCGTGRFTIPLARLNLGKPLLIYAVDHSAAMIALLKHKIDAEGITNIIIVNEDISRWNPPLDLNVILLSEVLGVLSNPESFLVSLKRAFRGEGMILIRTPSHSQIEKIEWLKYFSGAFDLDKQRTPDVNQIIAILNQEGFQLLYSTEVNESRKLLKYKYIGMLAAKSYSILHSLSESNFAAGMENLRRDIQHLDDVQHTLFLSFIALITKKELVMRIPFKKSLSTIPREDAHGGSGGRQLILSKADNVSITLEAMTKGFLAPSGAFDWHHHDHIDEFFVVLKGHGKVRYKNIDGSETVFDYEPGDVFYSPTGVEHRIECSSEGPSEYFFTRITS